MVLQDTFESMDCLWNTVDHCRIDLYVLELHRCIHAALCAVSVFGHACVCKHQFPDTFPTVVFTLNVRTNSYL